jgi:hypothetical protein
MDTKDYEIRIATLNHEVSKLETLKAKYQQELDKAANSTFKTPAIKTLEDEINLVVKKREFEAKKQERVESYQQYIEETEKRIAERLLKANDLQKSVDHFRSKTKADEALKPLQDKVRRFNELSCELAKIYYEMQHFKSKDVTDFYGSLTVQREIKEFFYATAIQNTVSFTKLDTGISVINQMAWQGRANHLQSREESILEMLERKSNGG